MNISISSPFSNSTVSWTFMVQGTYNLGVGDPETGGSPGTVVVVVYQSDGTTPLASTTVTPTPVVLAPGAMMGVWGVNVTHNANYAGAVVRATLAPSTGSPVSTAVTGINISQMVPPPVPPVPPSPPSR